MTIKITKKMASDASHRMASKAYDEKISKIQCEINACIEKLVKKYIPSPVIACVNEYPTYFSYNEYVSVTSEKKYCKNHSYQMREDYINGKLTFKVPSGTSTILVDSNDYNELRKIKDKKRSLCDEKDEFASEIEKALISLRTYKRVEEDLPEAVKYIDLPSTGMVPSVVCSDLNKLISQKLNGNDKS